MIDPTSPDFALRWPRSLFVDEAQRILSLSNRTAAEILVCDAFEHGQEALNIDEDARGILQELVNQAGVLKLDTERRPFWSERTKGTRSTALDLKNVARQIALKINELYQRGYFDRNLPFECVDDPQRFRSPADYLESKVGLGRTWPLPENVEILSLSVDNLFDVAEALHDVAARPVDGFHHSYSSCGWHYNTFNGELGRKIYRWEVNRILAASSLPYQLADEGDDVGRIVATTDDARADLVTTMLRRTGQSQDRVAHAITLFRARGATREDKRSAVKNLADVLENQRRVLKSALLAKDEGALFQIANQFDLRHHNDGQQSDYDPAFVDWVFWWYLATVELVDKLLARQEATVL